MLHADVESHSPAQHCYSMRLALPFSTLLREYEGFPLELLPDPETVDPDERVPIEVVHELLSGAIEITGDPDLGLKAARKLEIGDIGALEYAAGSAATVGAALEVIARYMALVNDALRVEWEMHHERVILRMHSAVPLPRAAEDFELGAFAQAASFRQSEGYNPSYEVHFMHPEPKDTSEYALSFPHGRPRFGQPTSAFLLSRELFERPMPTADPKLHEVIRKHADVLLSELPDNASFAGRVRDLLMAELRGGNPTAPHIAQQLHISSRTLTRKLEQEGTTFKGELENLRKQLARGYVGGTDLTLSEIAFLLGFSQVAAFHRAFKRWTGKTPMEYRRGAD